MVNWPVLSDGRIDAEELRVTSNRARYYWHPEHDPGDYFVSVTNVAKLFDSSGGLSWWQRGLIADRWLEDAGYTERLKQEGVDVRKHLITIPDRVARQAADQGTFIHALLETYLTAGLTDSEAQDRIAQHTSDDGARRRMVGKFVQAVKALQYLRAIPLGVEAVAYNRTSPTKYAGTVDLIAQLDPGSPIYELVGATGGAPLNAIIDLKTGKGVYDASALQIAAYLNATDFHATPEKLELDVAHTVGLVLHAKPKSWSVIPVVSGASWTAFRACLAVHTSRSGGDVFLGAPILR